MGTLGEWDSAFRFPLDLLNPVPWESAFMGNIARDAEPAR